MRALVLGGGGARGALQVGALRALFEVGFQPELLVGTSIGALNAAYLARNGCNLAAVDGLEAAWYDAAAADLLPDNYLWLTVRTLFGRGGSDVAERVSHFCMDHGLSLGLRFGDLVGPRLILVASDLAAGAPVLYGTNPDDLVLSGVLASIALPPWVRPLVDDNRLLIDGGAVSNLPIEPALSQGASEIIALDLSDPRPVGLGTRGPGPFLYQLIHTVERRHLELEKELAAARQVPVFQILLQSESPLAIWEFPRAVTQFKVGYEAARRYLAEHPELSRRRVRKLWRLRLWPGRSARGPVRK